MKIKDISILKYQQDPLDKKKKSEVRDTKDTKARDSVELSDKARELLNAQKLEKKKEVESRLKSDFYSQKDVLEKVASGLLKDIKQDK